MELYLKITAGLLLLVQAFHLASLQNSTDSPGRTIDKSWLRDPGKKTAGSQNAAVPGEETEYDQGADATTIDSSNDYSSGIASGFNAVEEEHVTGRDKANDDLTVATAVSPTFPHVTTKQPEIPDATVSPTNATTDQTNSSRSNVTDIEEEFRNSTATPQNSTHLSGQNSTSFYSNHTDLQTTTSAPGLNDTQESTTKPDKDTWLTNVTESVNTTTVATTTSEMMETTSSSTTVFLSETTETSSTSAVAPNTPEKANKTDKGSASGSSSDRGLESDHHRSKRNGAWGAVLGTAVAVAFVGMVAYFILKKKHQKGFSHRKLVEEFPSDPVLRLDNSEPLDLNFGGSAYYNRGLQGDNIQMTSFPGSY